MTTTIPHDRADQLQRVELGLFRGEEIYALYDCTGAGTGFVGVTNLRVVLRDDPFVEGRSAVTSLPIRSIDAVSFVLDRSLFGRHLTSATIAITSGSTVREATFRGEDRARHVHDTILWLLTQG